MPQFRKSKEILNTPRFFPLCTNQTWACVSIRVRDGPTMTEAEVEWTLIAGMDSGRWLFGTSSDIFLCSEIKFKWDFLPTLFHHPDIFLPFLAGFQTMTGSMKSQHSETVPHKWGYNNQMTETSCCWAMLVFSSHPPRRVIFMAFKTAAETRREMEPISYYNHPVCKKRHNSKKKKKCKGRLGAMFIWVNETQCMYRREWTADFGLLVSLWGGGSVVFGWFVKTN